MMTILLPLFAYLLGSVSSAIVVSRIIGIQDPRQVGSGNPGATNVLRYGGKKAAIITLAGDILKGAVPVVLAHALKVDVSVLGLTMLAAFLGHVFPVFHGFKGGKGVATAAGALIALNPWVGLALVATWIVMAFTTRYSSLSAIVVSVLAPLYVWFLTGEAVLTILTIVMTALLVFRHRSNIRNLVDGTETRIGQK